MACPNLSRCYLDHALPRSLTYATHLTGTLLWPVSCLVAQIRFAQLAPAFTSTQSCSARSDWRSSSIQVLPIFAKSQNSQPSLLQLYSVHGPQSCRNALLSPWWCWWILWPQGRSDYTQSWIFHGRTRLAVQSLLLNYHSVTRIADDLILGKPSALVLLAQSNPLFSLP